MSSNNPPSPESLESRLRTLELENERLRAHLSACETPHRHLNGSSRSLQSTTEPSLSLSEYKRYGRQMIIPSIGLPGQLRLKSASVLIVGAGGLGCPAAAYLAGAGVGTLGICDGDTVESSNLHRQIAHATSRVGMSKVGSMIDYLQELNPYPNYRPHAHHLTPEIAAETFAPYDLILDCTDHPSVRYLISDTCVLLNKPLVSASALRTEGQLLVLNNPPGKGACYRCIWPRPPPPESMLSCSEGGILGPVVGVMGVLMAVEALKLLTAPPAPPAHPAPSETGPESKDQPQTTKKERTNMLLYSAFSPDSPFRTLKLRGRKAGCIGCDPAASSLTLDSLKDGQTDYIAFCGTRNLDRVTEKEKIDVLEYAKLREQGKEHVLIDVREEVEWGICKIGGGGVNIPITRFLSELPLPGEKRGRSAETPEWLPGDEKMPIYVVCKQGNDSQVAVRRLKRYLAARRRRGEGSPVGESKEGDDDEEEAWKGGIWDVKGGLVEWRRLVDKEFPEY